MSTSRRVFDDVSYSQAVDQLEDVVALLLDIESYEVLDVGAAANDMLGRSRESAIGTHFSKWLVDDDLLAFNKLVKLVLRRNKTRRSRVRMSTGHGGELQVDLSLAIVNTDGGERLLQVLARDIAVETYLQEQAGENIEQLSQETRRLQEDSRTDIKTGLANYRRFRENLAQLSSKDPSQRPAHSLIFLDVDHFKNYNDCNGHEAGDAALAMLSETMHRVCRRTDMPARYGGEEFVILCPETAGIGALSIAERLRSEVEKAPFPHQETQPGGTLTISIGVASSPDNATSPEALLEVADRALYQAKERGRNRVIVSSESL